MKTKFLIALSVLALMVSGVSAQDSNTTEVFNQTDFVVEDTWTGDAFAADSLANLSAEIALDTNESLTATLTGYNSSAETSNQTFDLVDGTQELEISSYSENTSTYLLDLEAENGSVSVLDIGVTGTEGNTSVSGAAPGAGGLFTGNFFSSLPANPLAAIPNFVGDLLAGIGNAIGGVFA